MASRAFPFNFCIIKWLFSRDLHYLRSGITAVRRITPGTNSFKGALFTNSPMNGIPLPPLFPRGRQGAGGAVGRTTNAQQPARPRHYALSAPRPPASFQSRPAERLNLYPPPRAQRPPRRTRRGGGGGKEEAGRGERHTRPGRALSAVRAPPPAGANTRGEQHGTRAPDRPSPTHRPTPTGFSSRDTVPGRHPPPRGLTQAGDLALGLLGVTGVHLGRAFPDRAREKTKARRGRSSAAQTETKA